MEQQEGLRKDGPKGPAEGICSAWLSQGEGRQGGAANAGAWYSQGCAGSQDARGQLWDEVV